uniref:Uncharacterized protein n=1 Tax=viral metagenome TaxID=1070528 RepID=A0A6C0DZB1_9ZZZZ
MASMNVVELAIKNIQNVSDMAAIIIYYSHIILYVAFMGILLA